MADYTITLTDLEDRGVSAAVVYINANPSNYNEDGTPVQYASNAEYIQFVMSRAADSYVASLGVT